MEQARTILVSGLGGGLDIVNATLLYHALRNDGRSGSAAMQLTSVSDIEFDLVPFATLS